MNLLNKKTALKGINFNLPSFDLGDVQKKQKDNNVYNGTTRHKCHGYNKLDAVPIMMHQSLLLRLPIYLTSDSYEYLSVKFRNFRGFYFLETSHSNVGSFGKIKPSRNGEIMYSVVY